MLQDILRDRYPKEVILADGSKVIFRPMTSGDGDALLAFFQQVPEGDRLFLRQDVANKWVIEAWCRELDYERVLPLLAEVEGQIVADATLHRRRSGWKRHLGEIRMVVHPGYSKKGLGSRLVQELVEIAGIVGLDRLEVQLMSPQTAAIRAFERLGFSKIAILPDHVRDLKGQIHDLVILVCDIEAERF